MFWTTHYNYLGPGEEEIAINNSERSGCFPIYRASNSQEELLFFNKKGVEIMHQKQLALKNKKLKKAFIWVFAIT